MRDSVALPSAVVDRASPVPFYFQLARLLHEEIASGRWTEGQRMASEPDICDHFDVSRSTVRQALQRLEGEGLIVRQKGRGTFVAPRRRGSWLLQAPEGFFHDEADRLGRDVTSKLLRVEPEPLPAWAAEALRVRDGSEGVTVERLRSVDGLVALYVVNHLPIDFAETVLSLDEGGSLYDLLERREGLTVFGGQRSVEAVTAGEEVGRLLDAEPDAPLAFIESVSWDRELRPFDCYRAWLRTDRLRIDVAVASDEARAASR
jgi:GntR family transcriptional regulator